MFVVPSLAVLLMGQVTQAPPTSAPVLQVGVFSYGPDGRPQAAAYATTLDTESLQYIAGCEIGGGNRPVPDRATDAWRVSGKVETLTGEEAVVRIDWQRIRTAKTRANSPGGSVQLTLHPGDRVPLDSATPDATAECGARTIGFEARFGPRPSWIVGPNGPLNESPAVTIMRGHSSGGSVGVGSGSGVGAGVNGGGGGGGARVIQLPKGESASDTSARTYTAELFLVRTDKAHPEKSDFNLQGFILRDVRDRTMFAFSPFSIDTSSGPINVQISGFLHVMNDGGVPSLVFQTMRSVQYSSGDPTHDATSTARGSSTTKNPMPGPDDVLSFELPPIRVPNSSVTVPDQYSVRLRIR
jgi:hypothetical protein